MFLRRQRCHRTGKHNSPIVHSNLDAIAQKSTDMANRGLNLVAYLFVIDLFL